jgi:16S rRNA G966 N2-methylase RsmD
VDTTTHDKIDATAREKVDTTTHDKIDATAREKVDTTTHDKADVATREKADVEIKDDDDFPYRKFYLPSFVAMFHNLQTFTPVFEDGIMRRKFPDDYNTCDFISDHFTEHVRVRCSFKNYVTPWNSWKKHPELKRLSTVEAKREAVYNLTRECNSFNPSVGYELIMRLVGSGSKILDPSAGWGDRMIAAAASNAKVYHGVDPNKDLKDPYNKLIEQLKEVSKTRVRVFNAPFEDIEIKPESYDLVLTSPPFFNVETYSDDKSQSITMYPSKKNWINLFYLPYVKKCFDAVKKGGYVVLYALPWMYDLVEQDYDTFYFSVGSGKIREIRVWQKS